MGEYKVKEYKHNPKRQKEYWDAAIGLQEVDDLKPSKYLYELSEKNISGEMPIQSVKEKLNGYYRVASDKERTETMECDIVCVRMVELLTEQTVSLNPSALKSIHRYLFDGIYDFAGQFRDYNITKDEYVLCGDTVKYANYFEIQDILEYDFRMEKQQKYSKMSNQQIIKRLCEFSSSIWQVHPFGEGNTRTIAVFMELYLNSIGFNVNNDMFKEYSKYYRNALVRSNYANYAKGIDIDFCFLEKFYDNLLFDGVFELKNDDMIITVDCEAVKWLFFDVGSTLVDEHISYEHRMRDIAKLADTAYEKVLEIAKEFYKQNRKGDLETAKLLGVELPKWHIEDEILYSDATKCLEVLSNRYKIGIIANQSLGTEERLKQHGILQYIDLIIASAEEGVAKPNKRIFEIALERSDCKPCNAIMIGDRVDNDIIPANLLGMRTVWIKQGFGQYWNVLQDIEKADYIVNNLTELCDIL